MQWQPLAIRSKYNNHMKNNNIRKEIMFDNVEYINIYLFHEEGAAASR